MMTSCAVVFAALISISSFNLAYGHGGDPYDQDVLDLDDRTVVISTKIHPPDLSAYSLDDARFTVNFFDNSTKQSFDHVTYELSIFRHGDLLARDLFYSKNGTLHVDMRPEPHCNEVKLWKCTVYYGDREPTSGGLYTHGQNNPVIKGPVIYQGGLFHFNIKVLGAEYPTRSTSEPLSFDTYVSVAKEQTFYIDPARV